MANKHAGEVACTIAGKEFVLKPTSNAMAMAEEYTGCPVFDIEHVGVREARGIFFSVARGQHDIRFVDDVGMLMDDDLVGVIRASVEVVRAFFLLTGKATTKA